MTVLIWQKLWFTAKNIIARLITMSIEVGVMHAWSVEKSKNLFFKKISKRWLYFPKQIALHLIISYTWKNARVFH